MFGRKKTSGPDHAPSFVAKFLDHQLETERMKDAARSDRRSVAILRPQIPIAMGSSAGWFGGNAALPEGMAWPEKDGQKLLFVGQIDLSALPEDLWSGAGPRSGWLGIFLPAQWPPQPTVLHFDGPLAEAKGPPPNSADWTRIHDFNEPKTFALPKWPLVVDTRPGNELHQSDILESKQAAQQGTLLDPAYQPFDRETVSLVCTALGEAVTRLARDIVRFPVMKKLRPADAAWFARMRPAALDTFVRFFEIEGRMRSAREVDLGTIAAVVDELAKLDAYHLEYRRNDDDGYCELVLGDAKLLDWAPDGSELRRWWHQYEAGLTNHAIKAYTSAPATLPKALRERLEREWRSQTQDGLAAMGHAPLGHIYTPHGPDSPNEVLIEIHTSKIAGFIWADCYSLVLILDREALRRADFSNVMFDITN